MLASKDFNDGHYTSPPQHGIRAFARVYSAWAYGQTVRPYPTLRVIYAAFEVDFGAHSGSANISINSTASAFIGPARGRVDSEPYNFLGSPT